MDTEGCGEPRWSRWSIPGSLRLPLRIHQTLDVVPLPNGALSSCLPGGLFFPSYSSAVKSVFHPSPRTVSWELHLQCPATLPALLRGLHRCLRGATGHAGASRGTFLGRSGAVCSLSGRKGRERLVRNKKRQRVNWTGHRQRKLPLKCVYLVCVHTRGSDPRVWPALGIRGQTRRTSVSDIPAAGDQSNPLGPGVPPGSGHGRGFPQDGFISPWTRTESLPAPSTADQTTRRRPLRYPGIPEIPRLRLAACSNTPAAPAAPPPVHTTDTRPVPVPRRVSAAAEPRPGAGPLPAGGQRPRRRNPPPSAEGRHRHRDRHRVRTL